MKTHIQLIIATVVITVLIWVYADLSSHELYEIHLPVKLVVPPNSELVVHIEGALPDRPDVFEVRVRLIGPKAAIRRLRDKRTEGLVLEIPVDSQGAGTQDIRRSVDIREDINDWARKRSFQVRNINRQTIEYTVDRFVEIELAVEADPGIYVEDLEGIPRVEPATVRARLLASQRDRYATAQKRLIVPISSQLETRTGGTFEKSLVGLPWQGLDVTYIPNRVEIVVAWQAGVKHQPIRTIPLRTLWPADPPEGQYRIVWDDEADLVQHIDVIIPPGKPRPLTNTDVIAFVMIEREDFHTEPSNSTETAPAEEGASVTREVRFHFPKGFEDVRVVSPPQKVRFHLVRMDVAQPKR